MKKPSMFPFHFLFTSLELSIDICFFLFMFVFTDSWSNICSPFIPKYLSSPCSVCVDGTIYLVADNTKKVYSYDPDANMWQKVGSHISDDWSQNTVILSLVLMLTQQDYSENNQFYFAHSCCFFLFSGPASSHAPWERWPGNAGWQALCHRRTLERHGGGLRGGSGDLQPSVQHLGGGVLPAKTLVLQQSLHHFPWSVPLAWALPRRFNITSSRRAPVAWHVYPRMSLCPRIVCYTILRYSSWTFLGPCLAAQQVFIYTLYHVYEIWFPFLCHWMVLEIN